MKTMRDILEEFVYKRIDLHEQEPTYANTRRISKLYKKTIAEIKKEMYDCVGYGLPQFLSKKHLARDLGWCEGRNELREEIKKEIDKVCEDSFS
jgi:hypothetical protein